jgi:hypothetical protein
MALNSLNIIVYIHTYIILLSMFFRIYYNRGLISGYKIISMKNLLDTMKYLTLLYILSKRAAFNINMADLIV